VRARGSAPRGCHSYWAEGEPEERSSPIGQRPEVGLDLLDDAPRLQLVHIHDGAQELEVVSRARGELLQRRSVLGEARAAVSDPGAEEMRTDPVVEADSPSDVVDVGADQLALSAVPSARNSGFET
jgi:hypothetical protein